jgi:hypothetical protein
MSVFIHNSDNIIKPMFSSFRDLSLQKSCPLSTENILSESVPVWQLVTYVYLSFSPARQHCFPAKILLSAVLNGNKYQEFPRLKGGRRVRLTFTAICELII